jgi:retinol-binding protein 3
MYPRKDPRTLVVCFLMMWATAAGASAQEVDLPGYFARLGPDASLWYQHVQTLANPAFEGRAPGTRGIELAAEYIEFYLRACGLQPVFPESGKPLEGTSSKSYRQPLAIDGALPDGYETMGVLGINDETLVAGSDYVITANARTGIARGAVSFVGYGIEQGKDGYSSFDIDPLPAIAGGPMELPAIPTAMITPAVADRILKLADSQSRDLMTLRRLADRGEVRTVDLDPNVVASLETRIEAQKMTTANVAGVLPGKGRLKDEYLVIGGHYDHLGGSQHLGRIQGGANPHANTEMLLGADDNASGTAAVLILAKRLAAAYQEAPDGTDLRSILFVAFTAEERGLLGSRQFVQSPPVPLREIHAMLNLDMVGHLRDDMLSLSGFGTAAQFPDLLGALLTESGLHVTTEPGSGGSDQMSFMGAGIPALYVMTGGHDELHRPEDLASTMNPAGAAKVIDLVEQIAKRLAEHPGALTFAAQSDIGGAVCCAQRPAEAKVGGTMSADDKPAPLPDTQGGRCVTAFLEAFNAGDDNRVRDFEKRYRAASALAQRSIQDRVDQLNQIHADLGNLTLLRVVSTGATQIEILARSSSTGEGWMLAFQFEDQAPNGLVAIMITPSSTLEAGGDYSEPIEEPLRHGTIKQIGDILREVYVYPEMGERMAEVLARNESEGRYRTVTSAGDLAQNLTTDLFAVCKDRHLTVFPFAGPKSATTCSSRCCGGAGAGSTYGFQKSELLPGNIGYVKFDVFDGSQEARGAAAAALASVAGCDALIFDLRDNIGGSPKMIQFISSYLFDKPTHLDSFFDRLGNVTSETWTLDTVPGKRFPTDLPVYVLTSGSTFSAAEAFAYDLKHLGRATVVGATTGGGAHLITDRTVNDRFLVRVPYLRAYNPVTKGSWEGVGVSPDIQVPASEALDAARRDATAKLSTRRHTADPSASGAHG